MAMDRHDRVCDDARHRRGQIDDTGLPPVRQLERNDVARLQADAHEMAGQTLCVLVERDATQLSLAIDNVNFLRMCSDTLARELGKDRKSTRLNSSHSCESRMPSPASTTKNTKL